MVKNTEMWRFGEIMRAVKTHISSYTSSCHEDVINSFRFAAGCKSLRVTELMVNRIEGESYIHGIFCWIGAKLSAFT